VTLVVKSGIDSHKNIKNINFNHQHTLPLICWILLLVLLLSIIVSIIVIVCVCVRAKHTRRKQELKIATHINGFASSIYNISNNNNNNNSSDGNKSHLSSVEMLPKYVVASPAQNYSTQKLYQWCQQRELQQQYKSLWTVNPTNNSGIYSLNHHNNHR
jgi:hypothetical protein